MKLSAQSVIKKINAEFDTRRKRNRIISALIKTIRHFWKRQAEEEDVQDATAQVDSVVALADDTESLAKDDSLTQLVKQLTAQYGQQRCRDRVLAELTKYMRAHWRALIARGEIEPDNSLDNMDDGKNWTGGVVAPIRGGSVVDADFIQQLQSMPEDEHTTTFKRALYAGKLSHLMGKYVLVTKDSVVDHAFDSAEQAAVVPVPDDVTADIFRVGRYGDDNPSICPLGLGRDSDSDQ